MSDPKADVSGTVKKSASNRLKRRLDKDTTMEDLLDGWTQCCFLVPRKLKLCNVARTNGTMYCGNHQPVVVGEKEGIDADTTNDANNKKSQERVPCPIDGNHSVYKYNLRYHLTVCTKLKQNNAMSELPYYSLNCNSYDPAATVCMPCGGDEQDGVVGATVSDIDPQVLAEKVNRVYNSIMVQYSANGAVNTIQEGAELITSINAATSDQTDTTTAAAAASTVLKIADMDLADKITSKLGQELKSQRKLRHVDQDILIVEQMIERGLINKSTAEHTAAVYVELGAGRGLLSYAVSCADPSATMVLVERSGSRKKVDKALKDDFALLRSQLSVPATSATTSDEGARASTSVSGRADADGTADASAGAVGTDMPGSAGAIIRARMDIRHCLLPRLPGVNPPAAPSAKATTEARSESQAQPVVVIAKHLCGVATDLAIHSVRSFPHIPTSAPTSAASATDHKVGIAIATCCHHACQFADYAGRDWFLDQGFTAAEFEVLKKWSGWANSVNLNPSAGKADGASSAVSALATAVGTVDTVDTAAGTAAAAEDAVDAAGAAEEGAHQAPHCPQVMRPENITPAEMQLLGWQVKRIIDHGRVEYINKHYKMSAHQIRYCDRILSPECVMIVANQF